MSHVEISSLTPDDWGGLTELHKQFYGIDRDNRFWDWKFLDRPESIYSMAIAIDGDRIVGQVGVVNYRTRVVGKSIPVYQTQDILILEDYRKGRAFYKLEKKARDGMREDDRLVFDYGFSIELTRKVATRTLGFTDVATLTKLVQIWGLGPYVFQRTKSKVLSHLAATVFNPLVRLRNRKAKVRLPKGWQVEEVSRFDERFDSLWDKCEDQYPVSLIRDSLYLNWRYMDCPVQDYTAYAVTDGNGAIMGFVVMEVKKGMRGFDTLDFEVTQAVRGEILDYLVAPMAEREQVLEALMSVAQRHLVKSGVDVISCWAQPHMPAYDLLVKLGFSVRQTPHTLIVRVDDQEFPGVEKVLDISNWYITHGDKDHY